jgi:hypothetical protein
MSKMSDISIEIQDRLTDGQEPRIIAKVMEIPIQWVYAEVESMEFMEPEVDYPIRG